MKIAPVSADLLIKLGLLGAAVLGGLYLVKRATAGVEQAAVWAGDAVQAIINPASDKNIFYGGANAIGGAIAGDTSGSWSLGGWIYDITHDDPLAPPPKTPLPIEFTGGATGSW